MSVLWRGEDLHIQSDEIRSDRVSVTPAVATKWLDSQVRNRNVQFRAMLAYHADMVHGRWHFAGDPIRFDYNGHLIDGQNRLTALAMIEDQDFTIEFLVVRGLEPESQMVMDQGAKRTAGQQLALQGHSAGASIAAAIRLFIAWQRGTLTTAQRSKTSVITATQVTEWAEQHPELIEIASDVLYRVKKIGIRPNAGLAMAMRIGPKLRAEIDDFYGEMFELTNLPDGSPTLTLAKRVQRVHDMSDQRLSELDHLGFLIMTWNKWVAGEKSTRLMRPRGGWSTENFPQMDI